MKGGKGAWKEGRRRRRRRRRRKAGGTRVGVWDIRASESDTAVMPRALERACSFMMANKMH